MSVKINNFRIIIIIVHHYFAPNALVSVGQFDCGEREVGGEILLQFGFLAQEPF